MSEILIPAPVADVAASTVANESVNNSNSSSNLPQWSLQAWCKIHGNPNRSRVISHDPSKASFERLKFPKSPLSAQGEVRVDFSKNLLKQVGSTVVGKDFEGKDRAFQTVSPETLGKLKTSLFVYQTIHENGDMGYSLGFSGEEDLGEEDLF